MRRAFPLIDFGRFLQGSQLDRQAVASNILDAFKEHGFLYLTNHGIPKTTIDQVFDQSKSFFQLSQTEKDKLKWTSAESNRGYVSPGRERVTQLTDKSLVNQLRSSNPDLKESMEIGKEASTKYKNQWPSNPKFKKTMLSFYETAHSLHVQVMDAIGLGLGFKPGYFEPFINAKEHNLRLLHYPSVPSSVLDAKNGGNRAGAHTDYGTLTLLFQDDKGGLQVKRGDEFIDATPIPDAIVINAGDLLSRWSNDIIKSTEHRVVSPPVQNDVYPARYSVAYFCNPNADALIECLPGCFSAQNPKKYAPINCHEYLTRRLEATY